MSASAEVFTPEEVPNHTELFARTSVCQERTARCGLMELACRPLITRTPVSSLSSSLSAWSFRNAAILFQIEFEFGLFSLASSFCSNLALTSAFVWPFLLPLFLSLSSSLSSPLLLFAFALAFALALALTFTFELPLLPPLLSPSKKALILLKIEFGFSLSSLASIFDSNLTSALALPLIPKTLSLAKDTNGAIATAKARRLTITSGVIFCESVLFFMV